MLFTRDNDQNKILSVPCEKCDDKEKIQKCILTIKEEMSRLSYCAGLAAPQVGYNIQVAYFKTQSEGNRTQATLINPQIVEKSTEEIMSGEGCMSLPGKVYEVKRYKEITVEYTDHKFERVTKKFTGFASLVVQHELNHLMGQLICDIGVEIN